MTAEPRLSLSQNGTLHVVEAEDDRGHSLLPSDDGSPVVNPTSACSTDRSCSSRRRSIGPTEAGTEIKKLRGFIPFFSSRHPDPLVVPLNPGTDKRFENADVELTIHEIRPIPAARQTLIELSVKPKERATNAEIAEPDAFNAVYRPETQRLQLEIFDSQGRVIPWFLSTVNSETSRATLTLANLPTSTSLKELRYHTLTRAAINVPFEFDDIPMP